jgi:hypothetical protein
MSKETLQITAKAFSKAPEPKPFDTFIKGYNRFSSPEALLKEIDHRK